VKIGLLIAIISVRSGIKTPSEVQWLRCRPPINAHIPMYAALSRSACALPLNLIWDFETTSNKDLAASRAFCNDA